MSRPPRALISLLRDSDKPHAGAFELVKRLRSDGIDAELGEFDPAHWVQSPSRIVFVCTPSSTNAPYQLPFDFRSIALVTAKQQREIISVSFDEDVDNVPEQLADAPHYQMWADYDQLFRHIRGERPRFDDSMKNTVGAGRASGSRGGLGRLLLRGNIIARRYYLLEPIGSGGFAEVWKARDTVTDDPVAIKSLHEQWSRNQSRVTRFVSGIRKMRELQHPGIVPPLSDIRSEGGRYFYAMPWYSGGDLAAAITDDRITREQGLRALLHALEGLAHAHQRGVIHRDVKPHNILLDAKGLGVISDFDLAHAITSTQGTRTGVGLGSVLYAAPEALVDASEVDARADVYGAGLCIMFVLMRAHPPPFVTLAQPELIDSLPCNDQLRRALRYAVAYLHSERSTTIAELIAAVQDQLQGATTPKQLAPPTPPELDDEADPMLDFRRLQAFLGIKVHGVKLVLARYEHLRVARFLWTLAAENTRKVGFEVVEIDFNDAPDDVDVLARLEAANADVMFVVGLEHLLLDDGTHPHPTDAIAQLNFNRDLITARISGIVVFWMSQRATRAFAEIAPDTLDVFVTVFELPSVAPSFRSNMNILDLRPEWIVNPAPGLVDIHEAEALWADLDPADPTKHVLAATIGKAHHAQAELGAASTWFGRAIAQAEEIGDARASARFRRWRGWLAMASEDWDRANAELDAAELLARHGSEAELFEVELQRAEVAYSRAQFDAALAILLGLRERSVDDRRRLEVIARICDNLRRKGEITESLRIIDQELIPLATKIGSPRELARANQLEALTLACLQQFDAALRVLHDVVLPLFERAKDRLGLAGTKMIVAKILYALGDYESGLAILRDEVLPAYAATTRAREIWQTHASISTFETTIVDAERAKEAVRRAVQSQ